MNIEKLIQTANDGTSFRSALEDMIDEIRKGNVRKNMEEMREEIAAAGLDPDDYALPTSSPQRFVIPPGALN